MIISNIIVNKGNYEIILGFFLLIEWAMEYGLSINISGKLLVEGRWSGGLILFIFVIIV